MGFPDPDECPRLCKLAYDYLKKSKGCDQNIYEYFSSLPDAKSLYIKLVEEFERCILSYFAFHWTQASFMINQVHNSKQRQTEHQFFFFFLGFLLWILSSDWCCCFGGWVAGAECRVWWAEDEAQGLCDGSYKVKVLINQLVQFNLSSLKMGWWSSSLEEDDM